MLQQLSNPTLGQFSSFRRLRREDGVSSLSAEAVDSGIRHKRIFRRWRSSGALAAPGVSDAPSELFPAPAHSREPRPPNTRSRDRRASPAPRIQPSARRAGGAPFVMSFPGVADGGDAGRTHPPPRRPCGVTRKRRHERRGPRNLQGGGTCIYIRREASGGSARGRSPRPYESPWGTEGLAEKRAPDEVRPGDPLAGRWSTPLRCCEGASPASGDRVRETAR